MTDAPLDHPAVPVAVPKARSQWNDVWDQFRAHKGAMAGVIILGALIFAVLIGPFLWHIDPNFIERDTVKMFKSRNLPPSWAHPMGTDQLGRDMLAQMMHGGRVSLAVGTVAMLVAIFIGTSVGLLSGYFRRLDGILMRLTDLFLALPLLPLLLVMIMLFRDPVSGVLGPRMGIFLLIVLAIGITSWMQAARIVRGEVLALKEREFVLAARSIGTPPRRIILRHILPNVLSPIHGVGDAGHRRGDHHRDRCCRSWASAFRRTSRPGGGFCTTGSRTSGPSRSGWSGRVSRFR